MRHGLIAAAAITATLTITPLGSAAQWQSAISGKVTVRIVEANNGRDVTNGGVVGKGHFTAKGAITDRGTVVSYRTVKGSLPGGVITLRFVTVGQKGTITYLVTIDTAANRSQWRITSATKAYKGLHGKGTEHENADHTVSTLTGTVSS